MIVTNTLPITEEKKFPQLTVLSIAPLLARTIRDLGVPAVFLEPTVARESSVLQQVADDAGVAVCTIYSDSLDAQVTSYVALMRFNAAELARCLGEG